MSLREFLDTLLSRWWLCLLACTLACAVTALVTIASPSQFRADASIRVSGQLAQVNELASQALSAGAQPGVHMKKWGDARNASLYLSATSDTGAESLQAAGQALDALVQLVAQDLPEVSIIQTTPAYIAASYDPRNYLATRVAIALAAALAAYAAFAFAVYRRRRAMKAPGGRHARRHAADDADRAFPDPPKFRPRAVVEGVAFFALSLVLAVCCNSLQSRLPGVQDWLQALATALVVLIAIFTWHKASVSARFVRLWVWWVALLAASYSLICLVNGDLGFSTQHWFMLLLAAMPLMVRSLREAGSLPRFLHVFSGTVAALACVSLLLWVLGPVTSLIQPNCQIAENWSTLAGQEGTRQGYFHLLYLTQRLDIAGFPLWRNTGIYTESPMYAFVLGVAFVMEAFLSGRPRKAVLLVLAITMLTTVSTTAISLLLVSAGALAFMKMPRRLVPFSAAIALVALVVAAVVVHDKLQSGSGMIHLDDFRACFLAWLEKPLTGHGFAGTLASQGYMSDFRLSNPGLSNSLGYVLLHGGIVFTAPLLASFAGYVVDKSPAVKVAGVLLLAIWATTIIAYMPLSAFVVAMGTERLIARLAGFALTRPPSGKHAASAS